MDAAAEHGRIPVINKYQIQPEDSWLPFVHRLLLSACSFHLTYSRWTSSLPSCLRSQRIFPSLPGSRLTIFLSRCKFSTLTTRQPMVEFYLLAFPRFPLRKKEHKSYFGKNRTHDFRTSKCAAYLLDHSGDERLLHGIYIFIYIYIYIYIYLDRQEMPLVHRITGRPSSSEVTS